MKKLFASDFDNTIYFHDNDPHIAGEIREAVSRWQAMGHLFGLCTGRPALGLAPFYEGFFTPDFVIASSGAAILDRDGHLVYERSIPYEAVLSIESMGRARGYSGAIHADGRFVLLASEDTGEYSGLERIGSVAEAKASSIHGISFLCGDEEHAEAFLREIREHWTGTVDGFRNRFAVDLVPAGCSKGKSLQAVADALGADETCGIGDSMNDLPLLLSVDTGYTFPTAPAELRAAAAGIVNTAAEAILASL